MLAVSAMEKNKVERGIKKVRVKDGMIACTRNVIETERMENLKQQTEKNKPETTPDA